MTSTKRQAKWKAGCSSALLLMLLLFIMTLFFTIAYANPQNPTNTPTQQISQPSQKLSFHPNKALLKRGQFNETELVKVHTEIQNKIEESPNSTISVLIKREDYEERYTGKVGVEAMSSFYENSIKKVKDKTRIKAKIKEAGGRIKSELSEYTVVEIKAEELKSVAGDIAVENIYPNRVYQAQLDKSAFAINSPAFWNSNYKGQGMRIAVLDTGIESDHPMLQGKVIAEKVFTGEDHAYDYLGHGTHVAGIAAGKDAGQGFSGIAPEAMIMNAKVLDDTGNGDTAGIIEAINWAVDPDNDPRTDDGADVIVMSLGGTYSDPDTPYEQAIKYAVSNGVVVVVSSGNCGYGCPSSKCESFRGVTVPGSVKDALTVGAVDDNNTVTCFSSGQYIEGVGIKPDVAAPGKNIMSSYRGGSYAGLSGTSMSAPHVAGAVALFLQKNPDYTAEQVKQAFETTSTDLGVAGKDTSYGSGMINLANLLNFDISLVIEYDIHFPAFVYKSELMRINTTILDSTATINYINAAITYPNSTSITFPLTKSGLRDYYLDFSDTSKEGRYSVTITVNYANNYTSSKNGQFDVISKPQALGRIKEVAYEKKVMGNGVKNVLVYFENTNSTPLNTLVELQIAGSGFSEKYFTDRIEVAPFSSRLFNISWDINITPGNYSLNVFADYVEGYASYSDYFFVIDNTMPLIRNLTYPQIISSNNPFVVSIAAYDESPLSGDMLLRKPDNTIRNITLAYLYSLQDKFLSSTFSDTTSLGDYSFNLTICDESDNCAYSDNFIFSVSDCSKGSRLLVVEENGASGGNIAGVLNDSYCVSEWNKDVSGTPELSYLNNFDAVFWSEGNSISNINDNEADILINYTGLGGRLFLEGADIASKHRYDSFMRKVAHSTAKEDISVSLFTNESLLNKTMRLVIPHFVSSGLSSELHFDSSKSPYPDSVIPVNGGVEFAEWENGDSSAVIFNGFNSGNSSGSSNSKILFTAFSIEALNETLRSSLIINAAKWLTMSGNLSDIQVKDVTHSYLINGSNSLQIYVSNNGLMPSGNFIVEVYVDDTKRYSTSLSLNTGEIKSFIAPLTLSSGMKKIKIIVNSGFTVYERNYLDNIYTKEFYVAASEADFEVISISSIAYENSANITSLIKNKGGKSASSSAEFFIDGAKKGSAELSIDYGQAMNISFFAGNMTGKHLFIVSVNSGSFASEADYSNNNLSSAIYICSKSEVLLVADNDAESYSTGVPDTSNIIKDILEKNGYCVTSWNESEKGIPSPDYLNDFNTLVWSAGNYWGKTIDSGDESVLESYRGNILFEGSDIAFDHENDTFIKTVIHASLERDLVIDNETYLSVSITGTHPVLNNISNLDIDYSTTSYPDSIFPENPAFSLAAWGTGNYSNNESSAIIVYNDSNKVIYLGFSISSLEETSAEKLIANSIEWLASEIPESNNSDTNNSDTNNTLTNLSILNPIEGRVYYSNYIDLNWTSAFAPSWCAYSLDGGNNDSSICPAYRFSEAVVGCSENHNYFNCSNLNLQNAVDNDWSTYFTLPNNPAHYGGTYNINFTADNPSISPDNLTIKIGCDNKGLGLDLKISAYNWNTNAFDILAQGTNTCHGNGSRRDIYVNITSPENYTGAAASSFIYSIWYETGSYNGDYLNIYESEVIYNADDGVHAVNTSLANLSEGNHALTVYAKDAGRNIESASVSFNVSLSTKNVFFINSCANLSQSGATYYLTENITNWTSSCIEIKADNVTLDCNGRTIGGNENADVGILINGFDNNTIQNCNLKDWRLAGVYLNKSGFNHLENIKSESNYYFGVFLRESNYNKLKNIISTANHLEGIVISGSSGNELDNVTAKNNGGVGISVAGVRSFNNKIVNSNIKGNERGIIIGFAKENKFFNNLLNNTYNAYFVGTNYSNIWSTSIDYGKNIYNAENPLIGGNFWANPSGTGYSETCADNNEDGFCDESYILNGSNTDYLPLSSKFNATLLKINRAPILEVINNIIINETESAIIIANATDPDKDELNYSINDSRFIQTNNIFVWQTGYDDAGVYNLNVSVSDGELSDSQEFTVSIFNANNTESPSIKIYEPENGKIYYNSSVNLKWTSGFTPSWCAYSLDGGDNDSSICPISNSFSEAVVGCSESHNYFNCSNLNLQNAVDNDWSTYLTLPNNPAHYGGTYNINFTVNKPADIPENLTIRIGCDNKGLGLDFKILAYNWNTGIFDTLVQGTNVCHGNGSRRDVYINVTNLLPYIGNNSESFIYSIWYKTGSYNGDYLNIYESEVDYHLNETAIRNATLTGLQDGEHFVTIWANDSLGYMSSDSVIFNIATSIQTFHEIDSCTELNESGADYFLTEDIIDSSVSNCLEIKADNVILDCQNHLVDGNNAAQNGININGYDNSIVKNCNLTNWRNAGIYVNNNAENNLLNNIVAKNNEDWGIFIQSSRNNILNEITSFNNSKYGVGFWSSPDNILNNSIIKDNSQFDVYHTIGCTNKFFNVTGTGDKPILLFNNPVTIKDWDNNVSQIILCGAHNSVIENLRMDRSDTRNNGLVMILTSNSKISNSYFNNSYVGIYTFYSDNNQFTNINVANNSYSGMLITSSNRNIMSNITARYNQYGVRIDSTSSRYNTIRNSFIVNNRKGVLVSHGPSLNEVYSNFLNNTLNVEFIGSVNYSNMWNTSKQSGANIHNPNNPFIGGNFWANPSGTGYSETCADSNTDGFCDEPYILNENNADYLPLSSKFNATLPKINRAPILEVINNIIINETESAIIIANATDPDKDELNYSINDTRFIQTNNIFVWKTDVGDAGTYSVLVSASDGEFVINQSVNIFVLTVTESSKDIDNDGIPDDYDSDADNDGVDDDADTIIGDERAVETNLENIGIEVGEGEDLNTQKEGVKPVKITENGEPIVEFEINFSDSQLKLNKITVEKQSNNSGKGMLIINGIDLGVGKTKTASMDKLTSSNYICIKDAPNVTAISESCSAQDEMILPCDGNMHSGYSCTPSATKFRITGLRHSGVQEASTAPANEIFGIKNSNGEKAAKLMSNGNMIIRGTIEQNSNYKKQPGDLIVIKRNGKEMFSVPQNGSIYLSGTLFENQNAIIQKSINDFSIKNENNEIVALVNETGYLFLKGVLIQNENP